MSENKEERKNNFCTQCGTEMLEASASCPKCGKPARGKKSSGTKKEADSSLDDLQKQFARLKTQWSKAKPFERLVSLLWLSIIINALAFVIGCFDVKEYYPHGQAGNFIFGFGFVAIDVWLCVAVMHRKSWARKSFIVLAALCVFALFGFEWSFVQLLNAAYNILGLYCLYLCFNKKVVAEFQPDAKSRGPKAAANRNHCIAYWVVMIVWILVSVWQAIDREGTDEWETDIEAAAIDGSSAAKDDMAAYICNICAENGMDASYDEVRAFIDIETASRKSDSDDLDWGQVAKKMRPKHVVAVKAGAWGVLKILKWIAIGLCALVGLFCAKEKK